MKKNSKERKRKLKIVPWVLVGIATLATNAGLAYFAVTYNNQSQIDTSIATYNNINIETNNLNNTDSSSSIARLSLPRVSVIPGVNILLSNENLYELLQENENYRSLFEDIYHNHLKIEMAKYLSAEEVDGIEAVALSERGLTTANSSRTTRVAAQVLALEQSYFVRLINDYALDKEGANYKFSQIFQRVVDLLYNLYRPVRVKELFFPFKQPLYSLPVNYVKKDASYPDTLYDSTDTFSTADLFESSESSDLAKTLSALVDADAYIANYNSNNPNNQISSLDALFSNLNSNYSKNISELSGPVGVIQGSINRQLAGYGYMSLSTSTFDQRLRSYSGTATPSLTSQSLVTSFMALDSINKNNSNDLVLNSNTCDEEVGNAGHNQVLNLNYDTTQSETQNVDSFINQLKTTTILDSTNRERLSSCYSAGNFNSTAFGKDAVIVQASNFGIHVLWAKGFYQKDSTTLNMKKLFEENLQQDLISCYEGNIDDCARVRGSLIPGLLNVKYWPLLLSSIFDSFNVIDAEAQRYLSNYENSVKESFNNYGTEIYRQTANFSSFELTSGSGIPIEHNLDSLFNSARWTNG